MFFFKILRIFFFLSPIALYGQTIEENLQYINTIFEQFNAYETTFEVDEDEKKLIFRDKFGSYFSNFEDIEIKIDAAQKSIGIFCLDETRKCISSTQKDGSEGVSFPKYTMELTQNGELIGGAQTVVDKFLLIKKIVLGADFKTPISNDEKLKSKVETEIEKINAIFNDHSHYQNVWSFDWENLLLIDKTNTCEVRIPIVTTVEYFEKDNDQKYRKGFVFKSKDDDIFVKCPSYENNVGKTNEYVDSLKFAEAVINSIKTIQDLVLEQNTASSAPSSPIDLQLEMINLEFKKYNKFNTRFFIDQAKMELIWIQEFGESRAPLDQIAFKVDYDKGWIVIDCNEGISRCITSLSPEGKIIQHDEYSMSLKENGKVIPHIDDLIEMFENLVEDLMD